MASLIVKITGDASGFKGATDAAARSLESLSTRTERVSGAISSLGNTLSIGLTAPILALGAGVIKAASDMEALKAGLGSVATASDTTEMQLKRLKEVAKLPGLGFTEAIQGSVRLQSAGFSASLAERSLKAFGNALATVGKGKADLDGVTTALSQIASKGKISAEEINQLAERLPQIRVAMKAAFGTADTEALQKLGIDAQTFVSKVVTEFEKLKTVSGGTKNSLENLGDTVKESAVRIGEKLLPSVNAVVPKIEALAVGAADALDGFLKLPEPIKNTAIALGVLAVATGPVISGVSSVVSTIGSIKAVAGVAGVALGALFGATVLAGIVQTMTAIEQLNERYKDLAKSRELVASGKADPISGLTESGQNLGKFKIDLKAINEELNLFGATTKAAAGPLAALDTSVVELTKKMPALARVTLDSSIAVRAMAAAVAEDGKNKDMAAEIAARYGTVSSKAAIKAIKQWQIYFDLTRELAEPESFAAGTGLARPSLKDLPRIDVDLPERQTADGSGSRNIGPEGMLTREQADAIKDRYKQVSKAGQTAMRQVSLVTNDLARGITEVIFKGGKLGDMFKSVASQAAQSITRILIEGALTKLGEKILGIGGIMGKVFGGATSVGGSIFSAAGSTAGSVAGSVGGATGGVGGAVGSVSSAGITGIVGAVSGVVSAVSGIIGNFQNMAMNKSLDLIEKEVRYSQIHLLNTLNKANEYWPFMKGCWESLVRMEAGGGGLAAAGGGSVNVSMAGAYFLTDAQLGDFADRLARFIKART